MRWKLIIGIVVGLIVAVIAAAFIVISTYDFNDLKPKVTQAAKEATGRELKLGGDIRVKIGLTPALVVEDVRFQNAGWGSRPELAKVKRFEVQVALLPLISGEIGIRRFVLVEPDILIETDKKGRSNLAFETPKPSEKPKEAPPVKEAKLPALSLNEVRIEKGKLTYKDGVAGKTYVVAVDQLSLAAPSAGSAVQMAMKGAYNNKPFELSGSTGPILALMEPGKAWPLKVTAKAGGATVNLDGEIKDPMGVRSFTLTVDTQGASIPEVAKLGDVAGVPDVGPFKILVKATGKENALTVEKIDVDIGTEELAKVKLVGSVKDPIAYKGVNVQFSIQGKDLAKLEKLSGKPMPVRGPFQVSGRAMDSGPKAFKVSDMKLMLGENDLAGTAEVDMGGKRPKLTAALSSQKLDLRPYLPKEEGKTADAPKAAKGKAKGDRVFPSDPLPLAQLNQVDANLQVRAKQILTHQMAVNDLTLDLLLQDGALSVKPIKAAMGGGTVEGRMDLKPKGKTAALEATLKVSKLDLGQLSRDLQLQEKIEGKLDYDLDIRGQGGSVAQIMAGLNGKSVLVMGQGRLDNKYIELLGADLGASALRLLNPMSQSSKQTEINCMVSGFDIKDGMANVNALVFDTSLMSLVGEGKIDLRTEQLDISLNPSPKEGVGVSGIAKVNISLSELAKPFKLGGTLASPSLALDPAKAAMTVAKSVGGAALLGPVGIAAALAGGSSGSKGGNPCLEAIQAAKTGVKPQAAEDKKGVPEKAAEGVKGTVEGAGDTLKKLFGR